LVIALGAAQKQVCPGPTRPDPSGRDAGQRENSIDEKAARLTVTMVFPIAMCFLPVFLIITVVAYGPKIFPTI